MKSFENDPDCFFQEFFYTVLATICYIIAFIVLLSGFGYCARTPKCDARIAAGVTSLFCRNLTNYSPATSAAKLFEVVGYWLDAHSIPLPLFTLSLIGKQKYQNPYL